MEHADGVARRQARDGGTRRTPVARRAREPRDGVTAGWRAAAGTGLALTLAVAVATVTATLVEAGDRAPSPVPATAVPAAPVPAAPARPSPEMLRLWGLRADPTGPLWPSEPSGPSQEVPRTAMEQLYADLLPAPGH